MAARKPPPLSKAQQEEKFQDALRLQALINEQQIRRECEDYLRVFIDEAWKVLNPGTPFLDNWHIDALAEHLEALFRREIRKLIINLPPRSLKSEVTSVFFPAWVWLTRPQEKILSVSFSKKFCIRDCRRTRGLIRSQWYQARWADKFSLTGDQNEKERYENDRGGFRIAGSVEGGVLGEGGSIRIMDDPNDLSQMQFPEYRQAVKDFYSNSFASRQIDPKSDVMLCVQQRWSYGDDMTSYLLELGGWEQLVIPCEFQGNRKATSTGWTDPRTKLGELMHPERIGPLEVEGLKIELRQNWDGQYNQMPQSQGGGNLRKEWFNFYNLPGMEPRDELGEPIPVAIALRNGEVVKKTPKVLPPAFEQVIHSWDMAFKDTDSGSAVAGHAWGRLGANMYLLKRDTEHRDFVSTLQAFRRMSADIPAPEKLVEEKANGAAVISTLKNEIPGIIAINPEGGKWARLAAVSGYVEAGNVWLPNPNVFPWVWKLLDILTGEPKDDTDAMTQALRRLADGISQGAAPEWRVQPRLGEAERACHILTLAEKGSIMAHWRRFWAISPNFGALLITERPSGALWVLHEVNLEGIEAREAGRLLGDLTFEAIRKSKGPPATEIYLPRESFALPEPWAELMENGLLGWTPELGNYDLREEAKQAMKRVRLRVDMVEEDPACVDRLRELLRFQPPDWEQVPYDRQRAMQLATDDIQAYSDYWAQVHGEVRGEWPKLKVAPECRVLIAQMGGFRREADAPGMVKALLIGVCAPGKRTEPAGPREIPWSARSVEKKRIAAAPARGVMARKFYMGRR